MKMPYKKPTVWTADNVKATLPVRQPQSHKGSYGTGLLVAGSPDMPGAAVLAGLGAMRSGIGKLVIGTAQATIQHILPHLLEATFLPDATQSASLQKADLSSYKAIAAGPGIEPDGNTEKIIAKLLDSEAPLILDAGALSHRRYEQRTKPVILTPHPAEFSRITGIPVDEVLQNREFHAQKTAMDIGTVIVLKGPDTIIAFPDGELYQNPTGNSSLAKGGTGDILTGMMLGMLCCHENWKSAVLNAVHLHGACADLWTETRSAHTLLAHELAELLPQVWKKFE